MTRPTQESTARGERTSSAQAPSTSATSAEAAPGTTVLEVRAIEKIYRLSDDNIVRALDGVSLAVRKGDFIAIIGPSGSGKSTLMHTIGLLDRPTNGQVLVGGVDVTKMEENELARVRNKEIGFVFQAFNLLARTTARENVELPLIYAGVSAPERHRRATEALTRVGLGDRLDHMPNQLSGGQQQRVAIARALVTEPSIILADEPTGNLDSKSGVEVMAFLQELHATGVTIVLVTHDARVALHADRVVRIADGTITRDYRNDPSERIDAIAELRASREKDAPTGAGETHES